MTENIVWALQTGPAVLPAVLPARSRNMEQTGGIRLIVDVHHSIFDSQMLTVRLAAFTVYKLALTD